MIFQIMTFQSFKSKILGNFTDHVRMMNKSLSKDQVFIKSILTKEFSSNAMVAISYFSDYDAVRIVIKKSAVGFHFIP